MSRSFSNRALAARCELRADRLKRRADQLGRHSARSFGVVLSLARMTELRATIASGDLPQTIRKLGRCGRFVDAYAVDFGGRVLIALYDRQGQSISAFMKPDRRRDQAGVVVGTL